jgi:hypothetical protein
MSTILSFTALLNQHASQARYYRSSDTGTPCPCRTPEGFRDPEFHLTLGKYGPTTYTIEPGSIPAGTVVTYQWVIYNSDGIPMSPAVRTQQITDDANFQVKFQVTWPPKGDWGTGYWRVNRSDNVGPYRVLSDVHYPAYQFVDTGLIVAGSTMVEPVLCTEAGEIPNPVDLIVKAFVQPIQSTRATRLSTEYVESLFGNVEADDHLGIFPVTWGGQYLKFSEWSQSGDDFIEYRGERFFVINANMIPDPGDGNPEHHWELGLRKIDEHGVSQ